MGDSFAVYSGMIRTIVVAVAFLVSSVSVAQNTMFLRNSPIAHLNTADRQILRETIEEALESPDGTVMDWSNPDTGSFGRVKVLDTHEEQGLTCRNLRARNEAHGRRADGIYRLCKDANDQWRFVSAGEPQTNTAAGEATPDAASQDGDKPDGDNP